MHRDRVPGGPLPAGGRELAEARDLRPYPRSVRDPDVAEVENRIVSRRPGAWRRGARGRGAWRHGVWLPKIWTVPCLPSTRTRSPVLMVFVAVAVPTTQGMPYSRLTMAAWVRLPPVSHTQALMMPKTGVHSVVVPPQTRMSPGWTLCSSVTEVIT